MPAAWSRPGRVGTATPGTGLPWPPTGNKKGMFLFFSNRLGCLGSLLLSAVVTAGLILVLSR